jgi:hypothetical protein
MTVTEIVVAGIAAMVVVVAALVLVLSIPDHQGRLPAEPRHGRRPAAPVPPPPGQMPGRWAEQPGPFWPKKERNAGPPGYGRPPGYVPPPLWGDTRRDPH